MTPALLGLTDRQHYDGLLTSAKRLCSALDALIETFRDASEVRYHDQTFDVYKLGCRWREWRRVSLFGGGASVHREVQVLIIESEGKLIKFDWVDGQHACATFFGIGFELHRMTVGACRFQPACGLKAWHSWSVATDSDRYASLVDIWDDWTDDFCDCGEHPESILEFFQFEILES